MPDYLGLGDRLSDGPSDELATAAFADELRAAPFLWEGMSHADLAHGLALLDCHVLDAETAGTLLDALLELDGVPLAVVDLDPYVGDVYNNRDRLLKQIAPDAAGHLHAGRARREATTIGWLIACRTALVGLSEDCSDLLTTMTKTVREHTHTVMPDFTYLHRAHPTTLGHYLLTHTWPFARHADRLEDVLRRLNSSCPAGSGSVNGTRIPLDRELLADLLGFESIMPHTRDAMWAPDLVVDLAGLAVQLMTSVDRLAEELQLWTTEAFDFAELADEHCRTSVIMPHKKNPYALTHLRGMARRTLGEFVGVTSSTHTASGQPDNRTIAYHDVPFMLGVARESLRLLRAVIDAASFNRPAMAAAADDPFMASTELCDMLTLAHGFDNRTAHRVTGRAIRRAVDDGTRSITAQSLIDAAGELGRNLDITDEMLATVLDPRQIPMSRTTVGGAGVDSVEAMVATIDNRAAALRQTIEAHPATTYAERLKRLAAHPELLESER